MLPILNTMDLMNLSLPPILWMWEGIIAYGTINGITADAGAYKTWLSLFLAQAISNGEPFLNRITNINKVIIFDKENSGVLLQSRVKCTGASQSVFIYPKWAQPLSPMLFDKEGKVSELYLEYARRGYLMIFDSLTRFHWCEENSASSMKMVFDAFQQLINAGGTVIFLHHTGKNLNDYRGSSEIKAGVDCLFTMKTVVTGDDKFINLKCIKHRFVDDNFDLLIQVNRTEHGITLEDVSSMLKEQDRKEEERLIGLILSVLNEHFAMHGEYPNQSSIIEHLSGLISKDEVRAMLVKFCNVKWSENRRGKNEKFYAPIAGNNTQEQGGTEYEG